MENLALGLLQLAGRVVAYVVVDILIDIVFSITGRLFLRIVTAGKYPPAEGEEYSEEFVQIIGFLLLASLSIAAIYLIDVGSGW